MGGHGGLNILPQKKWNVYNRDNRLKVARDEAAYEQQQQDLAEKHNAAEREHRRLALKQRARQRHGGAATINLDTLETGEYQELEYQPTTHSSRQQIELEQPAEASTLLEGREAPRMENEESSRNRHPSKRQKREEDRQTKTKKQLPPPYLAELARQLDSAPPPPTVPDCSGTAPTAGTTTDTTALVKNQPPPTLVEAAPVHQHINLFAEEEARAKNPEKAAEQRLMLSKRGDVKTQTTDAKFDESFQLGHGFGGKDSKLSAPWYARHPSQSHLTAAGSEFNLNLIRKEEENGNGSGSAVLEKWKEQGTAALIAAGNRGDMKEEEDELMLLKGVKLIPQAKNEQLQQQLEKVDKKQEQGHQSNGVGGGGEGRVRKEKKKEAKKKKKSEKKSSHKSSSNKEIKDDTWSKLREERLCREQEEQKRQNEAVRSALLSGAPDNQRSNNHSRPRYFSTYGYGK